MDEERIIEPLEKTLKYYFNYDKLRNFQKDALIKLHQGNVLAIMSTGSGKSMIYILPSILSGMTIVISPLISINTINLKELE